jgi:hypothetical protein
VVVAPSPSHLRLSNYKTFIVNYIILILDNNIDSL